MGVELSPPSDAPARADAHLHFFRPGYVGVLPPACRRVEPDEVTLYGALARQHGVELALAVGYEGEPWAAGNNRYLAELAAAHRWIRPLAYVHDPASLDVPALEAWRGEGFVGLSLYLFAEDVGAGLARVPEEVWAWLTGRRWLVSVNSQGERWAAWRPVLERHPDLRLLASHLGLPRPVAEPPDAAAARQELDAVLSLASFPAVHVKLSGFYALSEPGYAYPHRAAWPYVELLVDAFGPARLLWGSDFSPSLEWLGFPQTFGLFAEMPFLSAADRRSIEGENLSTLLSGVSK